jgi:hypothetical protein
MTELEKLKLAEDYVRTAMRHLSSQADEREIKEAARKAAKSLPPYEDGEE